MKGQHNSSKTHCIRGHAFDAENTYVTNYGTRKCRACNSARHKENRLGRRIKKNQPIVRVSSPGMAAFAALPVLL